MADITSFSIDGVSGVIVSTDITVTLPFGTDKSALIATFAGTYATITVGGIAQVSGTTENDFTSSVVYQVSDDGIVFVDYTVNVNYAANTENLLLSFDIPALEIVGEIDQDTQVIAIIADEGTDLSAVDPVFEISENATFSIAEGATINLVDGYTATVTSESAVDRIYTVNLALAPNHQSNNYFIWDMVLIRLPILEDTAENKLEISRLTLEVMWELETCFQIGAEDERKIGKEVYYNIPQRSIIADIIAILILTQTAIRTSGGDKQTETEVAPAIKFLSKAVAGSVEVEYDQLKIKDAAIIAMDTVTLIGKYQADVERKMAKMGCTYILPEDDGSSVYVGFLNSGIAGT